MLIWLSNSQYIWANFWNKVTYVQTDNKACNNYPPQKGSRVRTMKVADVGRLAETGKDQEESVTSSSDTLFGDLWADLKSNTSLHGLSRISTKKTVFHG